MVRAQARVVAVAQVQLAPERPQQALHLAAPYVRAKEQARRKQVAAQQQAWAILVVSAAKRPLPVYECH